MTNFEKYFNDLTTASFGLLDGKPIACCIESCGKCDFNHSDKDCSIAKMEWLKAEYKEPKITIPDETPVDTKVLVSENGEYWIKRHYAGNMNGIYYAWNEGRTSWTSAPKQKISWEYMKLYE